MILCSEWLCMEGMGSSHMAKVLIIFSFHLQLPFLLPHCSSLEPCPVLAGNGPCLNGSVFS